jgi:hypothetical protein
MKSYNRNQLLYTFLVTLYHSYLMNIVTIVRLRREGQTDTGEFRFLDPILNSLGNKMTIN